MSVSQKSCGRQGLDRDFILSVKGQKATCSFAQCGADGDGVAVVASFQPFFQGFRRRHRGKTMYRGLNPSLSFVLFSHLLYS